VCRGWGATAHDGDTVLVTQHGRPTAALVVWNTLDPNATSKAVYVEDTRRTALHELMHGLGFMDPASCVSAHDVRRTTLARVSPCDWVSYPLSLHTHPTPSPGPSPPPLRLMSLFCCSRPSPRTAGVFVGSNGLPRTDVFNVVHYDNKCVSRLVAC
jgi:hypothetical protein